MSEHYPRIRIYSESGSMLVREALSFTFYMRRFHDELLPALLQSFAVYREAVGPGLGVYWDDDGYPVPLDDAGWAHTLGDLTTGRMLIILLGDVSGRENRYGFEYFGKTANLPTLPYEPNWTSAVTFWMPTEYLEEHGPARARALALSLAGSLPFCSGYAGLSFNCDPSLLGVDREVRERCFHHPGMDIPDLSHLSWNIGTRLRGPAWLTFLGQPVLEGFGGVAGLRSRLRHPGTSVEELDPERVVVSLGEWPDAGNTEQGRDLPAYRELARVLEPRLYHETYGDRVFTPEDMLRWERRFLD